MINLGAIVQATDFDGDSVTGNANGLVITVDDDTPVVNGKTDLIFANSSNPTPGGTGIYNYDIGADEHLGTFSSTNSDFSTITLSGDVGSVAITSPTVTWVSESTTQASFDISFSYAPNPADPGTTVLAEGTLIFDKLAGTYTVTLDEPIETVTILNTANALGFQGYDAGTDNEDNSGLVEVSIAELSSNFFVQFTGARGK